MLLLASCQTSPRVTPSIGLDWPELPDPEGQVFYLNEAQSEIPGGIIVMCPEYWLALGRYIVDVERVREQVQILYGEGR